MAEPEIAEAGDSAEKAYAAAAEAAPVATEPTAVEFPSKATRSRKPRASDTAEPAAPATPAPAVQKDVPATAKVAAPKAKPVKPKPAVAKPLAAKTATAKPVAAKPVPARKAPSAPFAKPTPTITKTPTVSQLKDKIMATQTKDFTASKPSGLDFAGGLKTVIADVQEKAKAAFEKSTASLGDITEFAKGNVEAAVESGKILASGLQEFGSTYVSESKSAFEAVSADVKELAAQKTPVDFFKLQGELAKKSFDSAVAFGTKSNEAWMKLATDAFAPISGRVSLAVEKIKTAA